ncbi:MAG: FAD-binding protein, partial [Desulfosarcinaceae bacterium]
MILTLIEQDGGGLGEASRQALTFARDLAGRTGREVVALSIGPDNAVSTAELGRYGVSAVVRVQDAALDAYAPAGWARTLAQVMDARSPQVMLAAGTDRGNEVMAHLAAMADLPLSANTLAVNDHDPSRVTRMRWGSSLLEEAVIAGAPKLLTLALHAVPAEEVPAPSEPAEETFAPSIPEADLRVRLTRTEAEVAEGITLKNAPVVVGGGRGVGSPEGYAVLEKLAELLGGAVGCSRVATNNGWRPHSDQVGLTGTRISP